MSSQNRALVVFGCLWGALALMAGEDQVKKRQQTKDQVNKDQVNTESAAAVGTTVLNSSPFSRDPSKLVKLTKDFNIWLDPERKQLIVEGKIVLRKGQLEMFACTKHTKEHESIVAVDCKAQFLHAGLLALGAEPGRPVQFNPEYLPARGPEVEVSVHWKDDRGEHQARAQEWIQQTKTGEILAHPFVFAGSGFHVDEVTGEKHYLAEGGDLICVSNFTSAMLDLPINSPQGNSALSFQAFSEKIPPVGTPVRLVLAPKLLDRKQSGGAGAQPKEATPAKKADDSSKNGGAKADSALGSR